MVRSATARLGRVAVRRGGVWLPTCGDAGIGMSMPVAGGMVRLPTRGQSCPLLGAAR